MIVTWKLVPFVIAITLRPGTEGMGFECALKLLRAGFTMTECNKVCFDEARWRGLLSLLSVE